MTCITHRTERGLARAVKQAASSIPADIPDTPGAEDWFARKMAEVSGGKKVTISPPAVNNTGARTGASKLVINAMTQPMTTAEIAEATGQTEATVRCAMMRMRKRGLIIKDESIRPVKWVKA